MKETSYRCTYEHDVLGRRLFVVKGGDTVAIFQIVPILHSIKLTHCFVGQEELPKVKAVAQDYKKSLIKNGLF